MPEQTINILMWFAVLVLSYGFTLVLYKLFGRMGLFAVVGLMLVLGNLVVLKTFDLFGMQANMISIYGSIFLATDILNEFYGKAEARKAVFYGLVAQVGVMIIMQPGLALIPNEHGIVGHEALSTLFAVMPWIVIASLTAYLIAQLVDIAVYAQIKKWVPAKSMIWVRNNGSTFCAQLVDAFIFFGLLGVFGVMPFSVAFSLVVTGMGLKWLAAALDTPFIYIATWFKPIQEGPPEEEVMEGQVS